VLRATDGLVAFDAAAAGFANFFCVGVLIMKRWEPSKPAAFHDRVLLALVTTYIPISYIVLYFGNHNKGMLAVIAIFATVLSYLGLSGYVIIVSLVRTIRLHIFKSFSLLVCIILLMVTPLAGPTATYLIDQFRFQGAKSEYLSLAKKEPLSHFQVFDWGSGGFASQNNFYYLVFDETGETSNGPITNSKTASARLLPASCSGSVTHLSGYFYSVTVIC
jgi:hypothetical protein